MSQLRCVFNRLSCASRWRFADVLFYCLVAILVRATCLITSLCNTSDCANMGWRAPVYVMPRALRQCSYHLCAQVRQWLFYASRDDCGLNDLDRVACGFTLCDAIPYDVTSFVRDVPCNLSYATPLASRMTRTCLGEALNATLCGRVSNAARNCNTAIVFCGAVQRA